MKAVHAMEDAEPLFNPDNPPYGHELFTDALASAISGGRVAHGWLLTGPQGIGKSAMACMAAAWLLRENDSQQSLVETSGMVVDPQDPGSNLVCKGHHPDLLVIRPEIKDNKSGQIKLDQIRKLVGFLGHKPGRGGWRVAIIDSMDLVNRNGANALLKLLEEPPERTMLFLIASRPGRLPPTIRSRCRLVRLPALDGETCRTVVANAMPDEPEARMSDLACLSEGAPGRAISLAASHSDDMYRTACALLSEPRLDEGALAALCDKWGKGGADGQAARDGATWLVARLLRLAALPGDGAGRPPACEFETRAISVLSGRHDRASLAERHAAFVRSAGQMDDFYLDFGHFLSRELSWLRGKSLP